jgi:hypothetical protein
MTMVNLILVLEKRIMIITRRLIIPNNIGIIGDQFKSKVNKKALII